MTRTMWFLMTLALAALVHATDAYGQDATAKQFIGTWRLCYGRSAWLTGRHGKIREARPTSSTRTPVTCVR